MFCIKLKPRAYRVREVIIMNNGYPFTKWLLQAQTHLGWNTLWNFNHKKDAFNALEEWAKTLS